MAVPAAVLDAFALQISACRKLGSPFTAALLEILTEEMQRDGRPGDGRPGDGTPGDGALARLIGTWSGDPVADALPLRLAGALHALVLSGQAPSLAACYPGHADLAERSSLQSAVVQVIEHDAAHIARYLAHPPQTNETLRSAVLIGGFTTLAQETEQPLRLLEIGASAGLNSIWDKYRYRLGSVALGPEDSPVLLETDWQGPPPPLQMPRILSRAACDRSPIDLHDSDQRLRLRSYIWADQRDRLARLEAAIALALAQNVTVERADAGDWLAGQLDTGSRAGMPVIYHSIMWQYLPAATQQRLWQLMAEEGRRQSLAWLRFEPAGSAGPFELRLTFWRNGQPDERLLATAHPHGAWIRWSADQE